MNSSNEMDGVLIFPILIGDIGGTNARFSILVDSYANPKHFPPVLTADFGSIDEAIQTGVLDHTSIMPRSAVLAVAGPVDGNRIDLTNCDWVVEPHRLMESLGFDDIVILNDFEAQALAVVALDESNQTQIGGGKPEPDCSKVVLGPGTGLGVAGLVHARHTWIPVPGEGGHVDLGPRSQYEQAYFANLETIGGRISAERVLCGRGIVNLYNALAATSGQNTPLATPEAITAAGLDGSDPVASETLEQFVTLLGRLAGDLALVFMSRGGVYLAGGIVHEILSALNNGRFRAAFEDKQPHTDMISQIPVYVITQKLAALHGLAAFARTPTRFGVSLDGRRWTRT